MSEASVSDTPNSYREQPLNTDFGRFFHHVGPGPRAHIYAGPGEMTALWYIEMSTMNLLPPWSGNLSMNPGEVFHLYG